MADTTIHPNNQQVRFRGRGEREMPNVSQAQRGAMAAAAKGDSNLGISKKVGQEFMATDPGGALPKKAPPKPPAKKAPPVGAQLAKRGLVSDTAMKKAKAKLGVADEEYEDGKPGER